MKIPNKGPSTADDSASKETRVYRSFADDFTESRRQDQKLPPDYKWIHTNIFYRSASVLLYLILSAFAWPFSRLWLHVRVENSEILKKYGKDGCFIYGNHTQPMGDAFTPLTIVPSIRKYDIASPSNFGIPILGPLLPCAGALPIPDTVGGMKQFNRAVRRRVTEGRAVMVYPEAHVWPWYTGIRPFPDTSFAYPVDCGKPSFCLTTTYHERGNSRKPGITIYVDGPFYPDSALNKKQQREKLRDEIRNRMIDRSAASTFEYVRYIKENCD